MTQGRGEGGGGKGGGSCCDSGWSGVWISAAVYFDRRLQPFDRFYISDSSGYSRSSSSVFSSLPYLSVTLLLFLLLLLLALQLLLLPKLILLTVTTLL